MQVKLEKANANNFFCCRKIGQRSLRLNAYHLNWDHMKVKWNIQFSHTIMGARNLDEFSLESCLFQSWHSSCLSTQTSLFRQFVFGPFISPEVYKDHVFLYIEIPSGGRGLLQALGSMSLKLQACWSLLQYHSPKSVSPAFCSSTKSFVVSK